MLLDEPFSGIDIVAREEITRALVYDYSEGQQTIIISTHEIDEIENLVEHVVFIDSGRAAVFGDADELRRQEGKVHSNHNGRRHSAMAVSKWNMFKQLFKKEWDQVEARDVFCAGFPHLP